MGFPPAFNYFHHLIPNYLTQRDRPSYTPIQNNNLCHLINLISKTTINTSVNGVTIVLYCPLYLCCSHKCNSPALALYLDPLNDPHKLHYVQIFMHTSLEKLIRLMLAVKRLNVCEENTFFLTVILARRKYDH